MGGALPLWLGTPARPSFAWYHEPEGGKARAGAVICPPLGFDYILSHHAFRRLAERLAQSGFSVIRPDYDGMGDSSGGNADPDRVRSWLGSVRGALEFLRRSGVGEVSLVGMRFGATFAVEVAAVDGHIDQLVLWDPCASGSSFLSEQRAVSAMTFGTPPTTSDGTVEGPGFVFDAATVRDLRKIAIGSRQSPVARRVLLLTRRDRMVDPSVAQSTLGQEIVDREEAVGQFELMDRTPPNQELPSVAIERIRDWLSKGAPAHWRTVKAPGASTRAVVGRCENGEDVIETAVAIPPVGLVGMLTEAESPTRFVHAPTVVFLSVAQESRIGPARLWVELARRWAAVGLRSLRLDLSGLGDSPHRGQVDGPWACFKPEAFDDVADAVRWASVDDPGNVVLVGLCSSGYQALESALQLRARGVVAINPEVSVMPFERREGRPLDVRRRIALPKDSVAPSFREGGSLGGLRDRFPDLAWRARNLGSPRRRSGRWLTELIRQGTDTLIVAGDREARPIRQGITGVQLRRLERTGLLRLEHMSGLQHGLLVASQRRVVSDVVSDHVMARFSPSLQSRDLPVVHQ